MAAEDEWGAWRDVTPLAMTDGPTAPFRIAYSARYSAVYSYVRAVQASGELSARVLWLTGEAAELNPAHYTVWSLRRACLDALGGGAAGPLAGELPWLSALMRRKGCWKNYQVWHHRRLVVERLGDGSAEADFTAEAFADDPKNYHAWSHRQWAVRALTGGGGGGREGGAAPAGSWAAERALAEAMLQADVRNNSAWNHRWFVLTRGGGAPSALPRERWPAPAELAQEVAFAVAALGPVRLNEAAWTHLRACALLGLICASGGGSGGGEGMGMDALRQRAQPPHAAAWAAWPAALALARDCSAAAATAHNAFACEVLAEHAEAEGDAEAARGHYARAAEGDAIRAQYWAWRAGEVVERS